MYVNRTLVRVMEENQLNTLNILITDDSRSARKGIVASLQGIHAQIHEADDGYTAYALLAEAPDKFDLLLSDLIMRKMHGDELCAKIRNELALKDLPVIILSSKSDKQTILKLFRAGANDFLFKPFMPEELMARIRAHLDQRLLNKILKSTIEELKASNRMKDHFLAACSHDFRSPLQGILGYTDLLLNDKTLADDHKMFLGNIMKSAKLLYELIESLLDFPLAGTNPDNITMVPLSLADLLHGCSTHIALSAMNKGIHLNFPQEKSLPPVTGNPNALSRVFNNLLSNAVKFTPAGGSVTVSVSSDENGKVAVSIRDTGIGIAPEDLPAIFNFYTKASRKGTQGEKSTGLGLFISRQLVNLHEGEIVVESSVNEGSCFTVILPRVTYQASGTET